MSEEPTSHGPLRRRPKAALVVLALAVLAACQAVPGPTPKRPTTPGASATGDPFTPPVAVRPTDPAPVGTGVTTTSTGAPVTPGTSGPGAVGPTAATAVALDPPVTLQKPGGATTLSGKVMLDGSYLVGLGGATVLSHNGNAVVFAGGSQVLSHNGNSVLSHNGNAVLSHNGNAILTTGTNNIVAGGGGNILTTGTNNIVAGGGGNVISHNGNAVLSHNGNAVVVDAAGNILTTGTNNIVAGGGGNVVAVGTGNIVAGGGGNIVAGGGGNIVAGGGGNIVAGGGGNIVAGGGGNIVAGGGGNILTTGTNNFRLLQATSAPAPTLKSGELVPVAAMAVGVMSLNTGKALPVGNDDKGNPVYEILSNQDGSYAVHVPPEDALNVLVVSYVPGTQLDARLAFARITPVAEAEPSLDEDTAAVSTLIRNVFATLTSIYARNPDLIPKIECILAGGDKEWQYSKSFRLPDFARDRLIAAMTTAAEGLKANGALLNAGDAEIHRALLVAVGPLLAKTNLRAMTAPNPAENRHGSLVDGEQYYHGRPEECLASLVDVLRTTRSKVNAKFQDEGFRRALVTNPYVAKYGPDRVFAKPAHVIDFMVDDLFCNYEANRRDIWLSNELARFMDTLGVLEQVPAYYGDDPNYERPIPVEMLDYDGKDREHGLRPAIRVKLGKKGKEEVLFDHDNVERMLAAYKTLTRAFALQLALHPEFDAQMKQTLVDFVPRGKPPSPRPYSAEVLNTPLRDCADLRSPKPSPSPSTK